MHFTKMSTIIKKKRKKRKKEKRKIVAITLVIDIIWCTTSYVVWKAWISTRSPTMLMNKFFPSIYVNSLNRKFFWIHISLHSISWSLDVNKKLHPFWSSQKEFYYLPCQASPIYHLILWESSPLFSVVLVGKFDILAKISSSNLKPKNSAISVSIFLTSRVPWPPYQITWLSWLF